MPDADTLCCRIEPLDPATHAGPLFLALHGPGNAGLWQYLRDSPAASPAALAVRLAEWVGLARVRAFAFRDAASGVIVGMGGLIHRDVGGHAVLPRGRYKELAAVMFQKSCHGTGRTLSTTRALIALAQKDPAIQGCLWRCAVGNVASDRFARKLGFAYVGTAPDGRSKGQDRQSHFYVLDRLAAAPPQGE